MVPSPGKRSKLDFKFGINSMVISVFNPSRILTRHFYSIFFAWTVLIVCFLLLVVIFHQKEVESLALQEARKAIRSWVAEQGGIYVLSNKEIVSSSSLVPAANSIKTVAGQKLTLLNSAHFTTEIVKQFDVSPDMAMVRLTSLNPMNPQNLPDEWERTALLKFGQDNSIQSQHVFFNNNQVLKYMEPFFIESNCLQCHAQQGAKIGDIHGGICITLPLTYLKRHGTFSKRIMFFSFSILWFIGLFGLYMSYQRLFSYDKQINKTKHELQEQNENLDILVQKRTAELEKSHQEIKKSVLLQEAAFEASIASIIILDKNHRIVDINKVGANRFDSDRQKLIGEDIFKLLPTDVTRYRKKIFKEVIESRKPRLIENDPRGDYWFEPNIVPLFNEENDEFMYLAIFASDVSKRYAVEQELTRQKETLELQVKERTLSLAKVNTALEQEATRREKAYAKLEQQKGSLEEANTALKVLLEQTDSFKNEFQERIASSLSELISPSLHDLELKLSGASEKRILKTIQLNLSQLNSSFSTTLSSKHYGLSSREIQIASLIKEERTTKEIAQLLQLTSGTVSSYRDNIRKKLFIKNEKVNLKTFLQTQFPDSSSRKV